MTDTTDDAALLDALLDAAVDAIVLADADGRILRANAAAAKMFGHEPDAITGSSLNMLMPPDRAAEHDGYIRNHMETGERRIIGIGRDVEGMRADGSRFPLHLSVGRTRLGGTDFFVGIMHDLTRRRAAETALEHSQRLEAVGQLTGGLAHDFNNLLTVIIGNLELLAPVISAPQDREALDDALNAAILGAELTSSLLAFSRRGALSPETVAVNGLVERTLALLRSQLDPGIRLRVSLAPGLWNVQVDPAQLQSALLNLALNAQDAIEGGGTLVIETANTVIDDDYISQETDIQPGIYVRVSVTDTGRGMTQTEQSRAFEPFFTTKGHSGGSGLGLASVYGFIRQSGGHTKIYSEVDQGTTVSLYLPALGAVAGAAPGANSQNQAPGQVTFTPTSASVVVLAVDDHPEVLRITLTRLTALGYKALGARNAAEALELLASTPDIAVVFTDLIMPGGSNGLDLARIVRRTYPHIRVLLTSGYAKDLIDNEPAAQPEFPLLRKPYRQVELAARLRAMLQAP